MGFDNGVERFLAERAAHDLGHGTAFVEQQDSDVQDAVKGGECAAVFGFDVGDKEGVAVGIIGAQGAAGLFLKCGAEVAGGIVDLHDGGKAFADFCQISLADSGLDGFDRKEPGDAHNGCGDSNVAQKAEGFSF